jgi:DNA-binding HxlR family transcriptional regulator
MESGSHFDSSRAELFEALGHPTRVKILRTLETKPMGFAELKREVGIESSGHLQFHLGKLNGLVSTNAEGSYILTDDGREAIRVLKAIPASSEQIPLVSRASKIRANWLGPTLAIVVIAILAGAGAGYLLGNMNERTVTNISTYVPHGSQSMLSSATVIIPIGSTGVPLSLSFPPYSGYLLVTYNATKPVSLVYSIGATTVWTPISATGTNLNLPIAVIPINPPPTFYVENACGNPPPEECPSVTLTITATYYY